jgi:hypothetical protein
MLDTGGAIGTDGNGTGYVTLTDTETDLGDRKRVWARCSSRAKANVSCFEGQTIELGSLIEEGK